MAKTTKKTGQAAGVAPSHPPPPSPNVIEDEPHLELDEEEMDSETLRNTLGVLQDELANLRARQESAAEIMARQQQEIERQRLELSERQVEMDRRQREAMAALEVAQHLDRS